MQETATLGAEFARALANKDYSRVSDLLHPEIDFRALTPNRIWEASDADAVTDGGPDLAQDAEPDLKDVAAAARQADVDSAGSWD